MTHLELNRQWYTKDTTLGKLFVNGKYFCYTLEDAVRAFGIKIPGETAIPDGIYRVRISYSTRFKIEMVEIMHVPNFKGIRAHGGNDHDDTEGCICVARNRDADKIHGSMSAELTRRLKGEKDIYITIRTLSNV